MPLSTPDLRGSGGRGTSTGPATGAGRAGTARAAGPATAVFRPTGSSGEAAPAADPRPLPWLLGGVGAVALVALGGWALVLAPQAAGTRALEDQAVQTSANEAQLTTRVAELQAQFSDLPQYQADLARARVQVPTDTDLADLLRALRDAAATTGVTLTGVVPAAPEAAVATPSAATDGATSTADGATTTADGSATTADGATTTTATTTTTTTDPATGLVRVPLTLTATGGYAAVEAFLAAVQQQDRLVLLTSVALSPTTTADGQTLLTLTASGSAFALPATDAEAAAAAAAPPTTPLTPATAATTAPTTATAVPTALPATVLTAATPAATR